MQHEHSTKRIIMINSTFHECETTRMRQREAKRGKMASELKKNLINKVTTLAASTLVCLVLMTSQLVLAADSPTAPLSSRAAFLRAQRAAQRQASNQTAPISSSSSTTTTTTTSTTVRPKVIKLEASQQQVVASNRSTRTTDIFENGQGFNIFVNTICDRESMRVTVETSEPFYGIIHTRDQRQKSICTVEGTGDKKYELQVQQVLNKQDPEYCGVIKAARRSPEDKDLLQAVVVVRVHKSIERGDDKFFLINCTNQCRRDDCSNPNKKENLRETEVEDATPSSTDRRRPGGGGGFSPYEGNDECNIYKFPWVITLLWCMGILLLAMIISHCIMCSSLVCRCVKTEVEDREASVYEDGAGGTLNLSDDEDNLYNKKNHPMRIDYDNRDIYKTSNNYEPYDLRDDREVQPKTRHSSSSKSTSRRR